MNFVSRICLFFLISLQLNAKEINFFGGEVELSNVDKTFVEMRGRDIYFNEYKLNQLPQLKFSSAFQGRSCLLGKKLSAALR